MLALEGDVRASALGQSCNPERYSFFESAMCQSEHSDYRFLRIDGDGVQEVYQENVIGMQNFQIIVFGKLKNGGPVNGHGRCWIVSESSEKEIGSYHIGGSKSLTHAHAGIAADGGETCGAGNDKTDMCTWVACRHDGFAFKIFKKMKFGRSYYLRDLVEANAFEKRQFHQKFIHAVHG